MSPHRTYYYTVQWSLQQIAVPEATEGVELSRSCRIATVEVLSVMHNLY